MIRNRVIVELADRAFLRTYAAGEIAEVIHCEWQISQIGFADWLAVVVGLNCCEERQVLLYSVGDQIQGACPLDVGSCIERSRTSRVSTP
jgi:hypothetical protein